MASQIAAEAVCRTFCSSFSPIAREMTAFRPTAIPQPIAPMSACTGAAIESAVSAASET